jgi:hypothetical protein
MGSVLKPLKRQKRTAWRKKYLTQSQRWGKVIVTKMPTPQGDITTSEILKPKEEEKKEEQK